MCHSSGMAPPTPRFLTVTTAAAELGVSTRTVNRAIAKATPAEIPRDRLRLPAGANGRLMMQTVVEMDALGAYLDGVTLGRPPARTN